MLISSNLYRFFPFVVICSDLVNIQPIIRGDICISLSWWGFLDVFYCNTLFSTWICLMWFKVVTGGY